MTDYEIRFAKIEDTERIMEFIDTYWKKGHILGSDRELFEWQYINNNRLNFVLGIDKDNNIQGILGFIPYDKTDDKDIALALWKANPSASFLGIRLIMFLIKEEPHRNIVCPGINMRTTSKIYQQLGMKVDAMKQWYRLRNVSDYKIAEIGDNTIPMFDDNIQGDFILIKDVRELNYIYDFENNYHKRSVPYKSFEYFSKRYFNHPSYQYMVYGLKKNEKVESVFVFRVQECNGARVLRFVDCIGDYEDIKSATKAIDELLIELNAEYIDMYEVGIEDTILNEAGWLCVKESGNIIPNYFAPYEKSVVDIFYCTNNENAILFRGDGDQDRPN